MKGVSSRKQRAVKEYEDDLRPEYDLSKLNLVRGKYFKRYWAGRSVVHLSPDVAKVFRDEESVNSALRMLIEVAAANPRRAGQQRSGRRRRAA